MADKIKVVVAVLLLIAGIAAFHYFTDKLIEILPFFQLRLSWNAGMSFSMFNSGEGLTAAALLAGRIIVTGLLIWWLRKIDRPLLQAACGLIIGGALGNIIDSLVYGAVTDFLDFYWGAWHFPTFNVADSCITIGAALWLLDAVLAPPEVHAQNAANSATSETKD